MTDLLKYEREIFPKTKKIAGVDEAGRGPLAGPVTVGAYLANFSQNGEEFLYLAKGVNDSKKLTEKRREALYPVLEELAEAFCVVHIPVERIEEINILNATKEGMLNAVAGLKVKPEYVLTDAVELNYGVPSKGIIHGDALSYSIAAASVMAKVTRDRLMLQYAEKYPEYGFEQHKGYGTKLHIEMIKKYGPCPIHRMSFIKKFIS